MIASATSGPIAGHWCIARKMPDTGRIVHKYIWNNVWTRVASCLRAQGGGGGGGGGCFGLFITWVAQQHGEWLHITLEWAHKHFFTRVEALFYFLHAMWINKWQRKWRPSHIDLVSCSPYLRSVMTSYSIAYDVKITQQLLRAHDRKAI